MNAESRSGESVRDESRLADELHKVTSKARRFFLNDDLPKGVQRNISDCFKA